MVDVVGATTNLINSAAPSVTSITDGGLASSLSSIKDTVSGAVDSVTGAISDVVDSVTGALPSINGIASALGGKNGPPKVPLPNVLSAYASYDYIISLSPMGFKDINFPDTTYKAGKILPIICKTGSIDPNNRIQTQYGKYEFYIDNLKFDTKIGPHSTKTTNVMTVQFDVIEPYSLGTFILALQTASYKAGFKNWRDAPFLLTVEFRGNKENGTMGVISGTTRHIPIKFTTIGFKANEQGSQYAVNAYAVQTQALTVEHASLKTDTNIKGRTVQEVLQTGDQSLQAVVNRRLQELVENKTVAVADTVLITFPKQLESATAAAAASTSSQSATVDPTLQSNAKSVFEKLGVVIQNKVTKEYVQKDGDVNEIGVCSMGYSMSNQGDKTCTAESAVLLNDVWVRGNVVSDPTEGSLRFTQDTDIPTVINQVLLQSGYPEIALASVNEDDKGMKTWWRIDTQVYYVETDENLKKTGTYPRIIVYRIVPYKARDRVTSSNQPKKGYDVIKKQVVKSYDYIYTGKNSEVLKFDIDFSVNFSNVLAADGGLHSIDIVQAESTDEQASKPKTMLQLLTGILPAAEQGATTTQTKNTGTNFDDREGGGGTEKAANRAARVWHNAFSNPNDMININMEVYGDPFWIANSGQGNYTSKPVFGVKDLNVDNTVNWQTSEVDILINFKSPLDINQATGLYNFGTSAQVAPTIGFTGLYCINLVTNHFRQGTFRQTLKGFRRPLYESKATPKAQSGIASDIPGPTVQVFDDGRSIQTFDDGSTLVTDSSGKVSSTPSTE